MKSTGSKTDQITALFVLDLEISADNTVELRGRKIFFFATGSFQGKMRARLSSDAK